MLLSMLAYVQLADPLAVRVARIWSIADARVSRQVDAWFTEGDFPRAAELLRHQWAHSPHDYEVATNLGWLLENMHQDDDALTVYADYRRYNPSDMDARLPEAMLYNTRKRYADVIRVLEPVIAGLRDGQPNMPHPNVFRILAKSYERVGEFPKAIATWRRQLDFYPDDLAAQANIRRVEAKVKNGGR